jgi:hypothetical protein
MKLTKNYLRKLIVESMYEAEGGGMEMELAKARELFYSLARQLEASNITDMDEADILRQMDMAYNQIMRIKQMMGDTSMMEEGESLKGPARGEAHKAKSREDLSKVAMSSGQGIVAIKKYADELAASSDERNSKVGKKLKDLLKSK